MFTMLAGCDEPLIELLRSGDFIPILVITLSCLAGMFAIIGGTITSVVRSRTREQTKREIAAYVAEGTIDPDKAVAMLNAGRTKGDICSGDKNVRST